MSIASFHPKEIKHQMPYTEMMNLEKVGLHFHHIHVEVPEGKEMKHIMFQERRL